MLRTPSFAGCRQSDTPLESNPRLGGACGPSRSERTAAPWPPIASAGGPLLASTLESPPARVGRITTHSALPGLTRASIHYILSRVWASRKPSPPVLPSSSCLRELG